MVITKTGILHRWDVSPAEAVALQNQLKEKVITRDEFSLASLRSVAGVDVGLHSFGARASIVVLTYPQLGIAETVVAEEPFSFPYIPGLLAFREGPAVLKALAKLSLVPDLFIFDAHGYSHPRRFGLASHLGVLLDKPSIGCAKSKLCGNFSSPGPKTAGSSPLIEHEEEIGRVVRTKENSPPVFVSVGHKISLPSAVRIILTLTKNKERLPEPTRLAHLLSRGQFEKDRFPPVSQDQLGLI